MIFIVFKAYYNRVLLNLFNLNPKSMPNVSNENPLQPLSKPTPNKSHKPEKKILI